MTVPVCGLRNVIQEDTPMPSRSGALVALLVLTATSLARAQATNPPYLAQFPTVLKVKQAMQVADPRETALRQMGAFWQLEEIIKQLSGSREFRGMLPDEMKLLQDYHAAAYYLGVAIDSAFPGPYGNWQHVSDNRPYAFMRGDQRFGVTGIETFKVLLTPAIQELFTQSVGADQARHAARVKADSETMLQAQRQSAEAEKPTKLQEEQAGIRRCVESGRSEMECMTEGLGKSAKNMLGEYLPGLSGLLEGEKVSGLRMSGEYPGPGKLHLSFLPTFVSVSCADLVPQQLSYSVEARGDGAVVTIQSAPQPLTLVMRADERLAGPAAADLTGQVQVGTEYGTRTYSDGRTEPISRPVFKTFTRRCNLGTLTSSGPTATASISSIVGTALGTDKNTAPPTPPGLRMAGEYGSQAAFDVEFRPEGAVVGCRDVASLRPYEVHVRGGQVVVGITNGATPIGLVLGSDGRLSGTGTVKVDGRAATGTDPNGRLSYVPRSATCGLGTFGLAGGVGKSGGGEVGSAPVPARAAAPAPPPAAATTTGRLGLAAANLPTPAPGTGARFRVSGADIAGQPNPIARRALLLLNERVEAIVREAGVSIPSGSTPEAVVLGCTPAMPVCQTLPQTLAAHSVAVMVPDETGTAEAPELPAGRAYYLLGTGKVAGKIVIWSLRLEAKPGVNTVVLDRRNVAP